MEIYMIYLILIPFLCRTEYILKLWLGSVPENMVVFSQTMIFVSLIYALFEPIRTSVLASNIIARFMIIPNSLSMILLIPCYVLSKWFPHPFVLAYAILGLELTICIFRIYYAVRVTPLDITAILKEVIIPTVLVGTICELIGQLLSMVISENMIGLLIIIGVNAFVLAVSAYLLGTNSTEKQILKGFFNQILISDKLRRPESKS